MNIPIVIVAVGSIAIAIVLLLAASKPDTFSVERSVRQPAAAERIFPPIDDLRRHGSWSPAGLAALAARQ